MTDDATSSSIDVNGVTDVPTTSARDKSLGELVATATKDLSLLVRQEVELAKTEIKQEVSTAGKGAGLFGGAGVAGLFALIFLSIAAAYGLSALGLPLGAGFLSVGLAFLLVAAALGLTGKKKISQVGPPEKTIGSVKQDAEWAKHPTRTPSQSAP